MQSTEWNCGLLGLEGSVSRVGRVYRCGCIPRMGEQRLHPPLLVHEVLAVHLQRARAERRLRARRQGDLDHALRRTAAEAVTVNPHRAFQ